MKQTGNIWCPGGAWVGAIIILLGIGCEQQIEVDLPYVEPVYAVEGSIELNGFPVVFLSQAQGYFDPVDGSSLGTLFLGGAAVNVSVDGTTYPLEEWCTGDLPPESIEQAALWLGFPAELLATLDLCLYTSFDQNLKGQTGRRYDLDVTIDDHSMNASTTLLAAIPLDSVWWQSPGTIDSLGLMHAVFTDPDTLGNAYRWFAKRINQRPAWDPEAGDVKDADFVAPLGSAFDDAFFNGLSFEFNVFRGAAANSVAWDDEFDNGEAGFFKVNDTVVVRMCTIDYQVFSAIASYENLILSQGSPFALPANMESNIQGGTGLWAAYGVWQDTVICTQ